MSSIKLLKLLKGRGKNEREIDIKNKTIVLIFFSLRFTHPRFEKKLVFLSEQRNLRQRGKFLPLSRGLLGSILREYRVPSRLPERRKVLRKQRVQLYLRISRNPMRKPWARTLFSSPASPLISSEIFLIKNKSFYSCNLKLLLLNSFQLSAILPAEMVEHVLSRTHVSVRHKQPDPTVKNVSKKSHLFLYNYILTSAENNQGR